MTDGLFDVVLRVISVGLVVVLLVGLVCGCVWRSLRVGFDFGFLAGCFSFGDCVV